MKELTPKECVERIERLRDNSTAYGIGFATDSLSYAIKNINENEDNKTLLKYLRIGIDMDAKKIVKLEAEFKALIALKRPTEEEIDRQAKIIVDKFDDLMLPEEERLNELEWMIEQALKINKEK